MLNKSAKSFENSNDPPLVSVIIPSYNHENYVAECIQGVLDQTFQDFEIIITDDCSTDRTVDVIEKFHDPRIKLYKHTENRGASVAANNCILNSRGKYIAMLSSDDVWYPEKLEVQVDYLEAHAQIAAVFGKVEWIDEFGAPLPQSEQPSTYTFDVENRSRLEWLNYFFYVGNCLCHPCSLVRRSVYDEVGLLNPAFAGIPDFDLWIRVCLKHEIHIIDQKLIKFRRMRNESNVSGDHVRNRIRLRFENKQVQDHFLKIDNEADFLRVFPLAEKYGPIRSEMIPYLLGRLALDMGHDFKVIWGLENIYRLLLQPDLARTLQDEYNFSYRDFLQLTKTHDPFYVSVLDPDQPPATLPAPELVSSGKLRRFISLSKNYMIDAIRIFFCSTTAQKIIHFIGRTRVSTSFFQKYGVHLLLWVLMGAYLIGAPIVADRKVVEGRPIQYEQVPLKLTQKIQFAIAPLQAHVYKGQPLYRLQGWSFIRIDPEQTNYDIYVVLKRDQKSYYYPTERVARADVHELYKNLNMDLVQSGFVTYITKEALQTGVYKVGILFRHKTDNISYYQATPYKITRTPNTLVSESK